MGDVKKESERAQALVLSGVSKSYAAPAGEFLALKNVNLEICSGQMVAIMGKSGSGKSTLLNMITGIDHPASGTITVGSTTLAGMSEDALAPWRGRQVGIVFQFFQLIPTLTALENVVLPMDLCGIHTKKSRRNLAMNLLGVVGVTEQAEKFPAALSGGQQQRVAIARAMSNDAPLIVADEPTGNLDSRTSREIFALFRSLADAGRTVVVVTHEAGFREYFDRIIQLEDGRVVEDKYVR